MNDIPNLDHVKSYFDKRIQEHGASARGADWISLSGAIADQFALDRAVAWFESAWRLAGPASERAQPH